MELRSATAVASFVVEASGRSEEGAVPKTEEREESRGARDKEGNEETSSEARQYSFFSGFSVTDGTCRFSIHRRVRAHPKPRARHQRRGRARAAVGCCLDS